MIEIYRIMLMLVAAAMIIVDIVYVVLTQG